MMPRSMGRQEANREHKKTNNANTGVIITIYVEKSRPPSDNKSNPIKKSQKPKKATTTTAFGHDRRAQLLAYGRELRNGGVHEAHERPRMKSNPRPRLNSMRSKSPTILQKMSAQKQRRSNYERISTEETVIVDQFCGPFKRINGDKKKEPKRSVSHLCSKIKCALREISCRPT